jgi:hypothetical protein
MRCDLILAKRNDAGSSEIDASLYKFTLVDKR